jgi:hypothetical protein
MTHILRASCPRHRTILHGLLVAGIAAAGCDDRGALSTDPPTPTEDVVALSAPVTLGSGLADAFAQFSTDFVNFGFDKVYPIGYGFHPAVSTEAIVVGGHSPKGSAHFDFAGGRITATLDDAPSSGSFDLWLVKNVAGTGKSIKPESGDILTRIGSFSSSGNSRTLNVAVGTTKVKTDFDMIVVTRGGKDPTVSRISVGERTLMERLFFYKRDGKSLPAITGSTSNDAETTDQLIGRGAFVFEKETFGGNGRTCATCHRAERNLTIDTAFIATLPKSDPLFVAETNTALKDLEDPTLMRTRGLIRENIDGFDAPTTKFVERSVPHTLGLTLTTGIENAGGGFPFTPPDHRLGWGGDGAPGRSTLHEFVTGAIIQHFTKNLQRRPGTDFRLPTQEEADAIEAFQVFSGNQKLVTAVAEDLGLRDAPAQRGQDIFFGRGNCTFCHLDLSGLTINQSFNTNVAALTPDLPHDDGFLDTSITDNFTTFNVPPLLQAADTGPFFHNNARDTIENAVAFYISPEFLSAPDFFPVGLDNQQDIDDVAAFLRSLNAAENIRQVRKRVQFVKSTRSSGNTAILTTAIADTQDAINDLQQRGLAGNAVNELRDIKSTLETAKANADSARPPFMDHALTFLDLARNEIISFNPKNQF